MRRADIFIRMRDNETTGPFSMGAVIIDFIKPNQIFTGELAVKALIEGVLIDADDKFLAKKKSEK